MMRAKIGSLVIALAISASTCAAQAPLLYAPFDGKDQATLTHEGAETITAYTTMTGPYLPGLKGEARVLGGMNRCSYFIGSGFFPREGTCSLWAKPQDWTPATSQHFVFFASFTYTEVKREYVRLIVYRMYNDTNLTVLAQNTVAGDEATRIQAPIEAWQEGEWHHLALTWDAARYRLFIDGEPAGEAGAIELPATGRWEIAVGTSYRGWAYLGQEKTAIDEFTVWSRPLSPQEVRQYYQATLKAAPPEAFEKPDVSDRLPPVEGNLALASDGAFVLASSFANYESLYPDNLIDGNDTTSWQPFEASLPQWLEVRWEVPLRVNEVILRQGEPGQVGAFSVYGWERDDWKLMGEFGAAADHREVSAGFDEIETDRVRVVIREGSEEKLELTTLAVRGPEQPIIARLRPRQTTERAMLTGATVEPTRPRPGETVAIEVSLRPPAKLADDYFFLLEIGDRPEVPGYSDFSVAKATLAPEIPTSQWPPDQDQRLRFDVHLPAYAPDGPTAVRLRAFGTQTGASLELLDAEGNGLDEITRLDIRRFEARPQAAPGEAGLAFVNGSAALRFGDATVPPAAWAFTAPSYDRYHYYSQTGIHLYHLKTHPLPWDDTPEQFERICRHLDQRITSALRIDPEARFIVHPNLRPTAEWLERNPEERLVTATGLLAPVSFSSAKYNEGVLDFIRRLIGYLRTRPYYDHIAGYLPMSCGAPDSAMGGVEQNLFQKDRSKLTIGDHNPQAIQEFRRWLKARYDGSIEALREAWKDPELTFETAKPVVSELVAEGIDGGVFRDPLGSAMTFDYAEWLSGVMGRFYSRVMRTIKQEAARPVVVGAYYGYNVAHLRGYNTPGSWLQNNNFDLHEMLQNPDWDFFAGPTPYSNRRAGTSFYTSFTYDSLRLHEKLLIGEIDHRTFIAAPTTYGRMRSDRETNAVMKRDMAGAIIDGAGYWFSDWSKSTGREGVGWFTDPGILETISKTQQTHAQALAREKESVSEIAVFTSGRTMAYHDVYRAPPIYHNLIVYTLWDAMGKLGAPYDIYMLEDLADESVRDGYRLYVFLNAFFLTPEDRARIDQLKREGKTLLFFYAPGYVSRENGLQESNIQAVTGIAVGRKPGRELMQYQLCNTDHAITSGLDPTRTYEIHPFGYAISCELHPPEFGPVFTIVDPEATVLARYPDGQGALAVKDFRLRQGYGEQVRDWRSVYCAVPVMGPELLRGVARFAGVHLYCEQDVVLKADNRLLMLHNGNEREAALTISLPQSHRVTDAYTGEVVLWDGTDFEVALPRTETRLYRLN